MPNVGIKERFIPFSRLLPARGDDCQHTALRGGGKSPLNRDSRRIGRHMLSQIRPLFPYIHRYRRDFFWGGLAAVLSNAFKIAIPLVIGVGPFPT